MKVFSFVICFLVLQVSASFNDELKGALHSVQRGFGKLLSDAIFDVTDTVHCTINAVEHVLRLNGLITSKSSYGYKCRDGIFPPTDSTHGDDPLEKFMKTRDALESKTYVEMTPGEIHNSISKVNTTLTNAFDNHSGRQKMESISKVLQDETEQLTKVGNLLRQELHSISNNVNSEFKKFDTDIRPSVWSELEERNNPAFKIQQNSGQAYINLSARKKTTIDTKKSNEPSNLSNNFNGAEREFKHLRDAQQKDASSGNFPKTFKEVANSFRGNNGVNHNTDANKKHDSGSVFNMNSGVFDQFSPFYDPEPGRDIANDGHKRAIDNALSIIRDSERNEQIMEMLKQSHAGTDVFGANNNMFNF